jgi:hypothetical protein
MSVLQKAPRGLLAAFGLKVLGKNPDVFADSVMGVADVYDQYLSESELKTTGAIATLIAATTSISSTLLVPQGKCWRVLCDGIGFSINAADVALQFACTYAVIQPGVVSPAQYKSEVAIGTTLGRSSGHYFPRPLFLPSGWGLNIQLSSQSTAPANNVVGLHNALVQEFDI